MIFSWIKGAAQRKFGEMQRTEMLHFIEMLKGLDAHEIALVVATATNFRNSLDDRSILLDPINDHSMDIALELVRTYQQLQRQGQQVLAPGVAVWLHTVRAAHAPENRVHAREMWGFLSSGFPYVEDASASFYLQTGIHLDIDGYDEFPAGFEPKI
ncbi:MAG: hypothetical protein AAGL24_05065 [Pseudomonadota bacterium]